MAEGGPPQERSQGANKAYKGFIVFSVILVDYAVVDTAGKIARVVAS